MDRQKLDPRTDMTAALRCIRGLVLSIVMLGMMAGGRIEAGNGFCRGKPLPDCKTFGLFEASWKQRVAGSGNRLGKADFLLSADFGFMQNVSQNWAMGGTMYVGLDDDGSLFGIRARLRRWLNDGWSLDISPGLLLGGSDNRQASKFPGFITTISLGRGDWFAFDAHVQWLKYERVYWEDWGGQIHPASSGTARSTYLGLRFGSYASFLVPVAAIIIGGATWD